MAVRMMTSAANAGKPNVETVTDYPGAAGTLYMETTHVGMVLSTGERNGYDDSDFTAMVWNPVTGKPETLTYASTRGWTYPNNAWADATPEVLAAYDAYTAAALATAKALRADREAKVPAVGKTVKVVKGRKVPLGTVGEVTWFGRNKFARDYSSPMARAYGLRDAMDDVTAGLMRVGLRLLDGSRVFTDAKNVEVMV